MLDIARGDSILLYILAFTIAYADRPSDGENFNTSSLAQPNPIVHPWNRLSVANTKPQIGHNTRLRLNNIGKKY